MNTLVVYESMFGNTRRLAEAVAREMESTGSTVLLTHASKAPQRLSDFDLVVIGAPTHAHSLPLASSRAEAAAWAADEAKDLILEPEAQTPGVREWLETIESANPGTRFAAFSTRVDMPRIFAGDAATSIRKRLRRRGADMDAHADFRVDFQNRLLPGEDQRATDWAGSLIAVRTP